MIELNCFTYFYFPVFPEFFLFNKISAQKELLLPRISRLSVMVICLYGQGRQTKKFDGHFILCKIPLIQKGYVNIDGYF